MLGVVKELLLENVVIKSLGCFLFYKICFDIHSISCNDEIH